MKKIRRILSACVATVMAGVMIGAVSAPSASAAVIYGDVNMNGSVDITDAVALNQYIAGRCEITNYTVADLNANYIIDRIDSIILLSFLTHSINTLPYYG